MTGPKKESTKNIFHNATSSLDPNVMSSSSSAMKKRKATTKKSSSNKKNRTATTKGKAKHDVPMFLSSECFSL
eukprot:15062617-Ditylum_brightwellii.AAC.1